MSWAFVLALVASFVAHDLDELERLLEAGRAQTVVERTRELSPTSKEVREDARLAVIVARASNEAGDSQRALGLLAVHGEGRVVDVDLARARILVDLDRLDEARRVLVRPDKPGLPRFASHADAWALLGRVLSRQGDARAARPLLERSIELAPYGPEAAAAWHMLGTEARGRRDTERALFCFRRAKEVRRWHELFRARRLQKREHPDDPLPRLGLGLLWMEAGQLRKAEAEFDQLVERVPDFARGHQYLGEIRRRLGETEPALASFGKALELDPNLALARAQRGALFAELERWTEAIADLELFSVSKQSNEKEFRIAWWHYARSLNELGRKPEAARAWARYQALEGVRKRPW